MPVVRTPLLGLPSPVIRRSAAAECVSIGAYSLLDLTTPHVSCSILICLDGAPADEQRLVINETT